MRQITQVFLSKVTRRLHGLVTKDEAPHLFSGRTENHPDRFRIVYFEFDANMAPIYEKSYFVEIHEALDIGYAHVHFLINPDKGLNRDDLSDPFTYTYDAPDLLTKHVYEWICDNKKPTRH